MTSPFNLPSADHLILDTSRGENPHHEDFMRNFRVRKCTQSMYGGSCKKGFKCFNFHFPYERRRPSIRNPDGSSNYSSYIYCQLYDEAKGFCPNGDACPYLHGDTERRYHVDVFKTLPCEYELNENRLCEMYGRVCSFAHGPEDMRLRAPSPPAAYSIGECQRGVFCPFTHDLRQSEATNQLKQTSINDASNPQAPSSFMERPPGIPSPLNIKGIENSILSSGLSSSSSQDPSSWSIWSSSDKLNAEVLARGSRYNSSTSEESSDIVKMLEQETILKPFGALFLEDEIFLPRSALISPVVGAIKKFDIFEGQMENNSCFRCGRDKDGSGKCPVCSK